MAMPAHLSDEMLSDLLDRQMPLPETRRAEAHLSVCDACTERFGHTQSVWLMLRNLPSVEIPRDFTLGPRLIGTNPAIQQIERWYSATRIAASAIAAVFVLSLGATIYLDEPVATKTAAVAPLAAPVASSVPSQAESAGRSVAVAPAAAPASAHGAASSPAGASVPAQAPAPAPPAAAQNAPADTFAATDSAGSAPAPPTPDTDLAQRAASIAQRAAAPLVAPQSTDPTVNSVRVAALTTGGLLIASLLAALLLRRRLRQARA